MTDLVKRLRSPANVFYEYAADNGAFLREAADHIEKLETALRLIATINNQRDRFSADIDAIIINALGEQNDDA